MAQLDHRVEDADRLHLLVLRPPEPEVDGPVHRVRRVEHAGRGGRPCGAGPQAGRAPGPRCARCRRCRPIGPPVSRRGWASSTGCSAAGSCPGRWCWSAGSRASARARCCCRRWAPSARPACARCWSAARSRRPRCACGRSGWASPITCRCWPRPSSTRSATPSRWSGRMSSSSTPCRPCTPPTCRRRRAVSPRCARRPTACFVWRNATTSRSCWSAMSPRTAPSPGPGCSSTWWTPCCSSRATATASCASCARSRTASARPTRSASSR